ncbi:prepilin-type N-terminal cleavage/methylation domain-containing protein [Pseudoalteromonas pernae]|uniref:prepilin-type N-terminal cleavage/methylation domain-containing protein n=1 Tax=Pseudoalteromonas pernae TaxID=3118054 RepID=UPI003241BBCE
MKTMNQQDFPQGFQKGFTLIELIIVIVILGILAVTVAPRFLNLQDDARDATLEGVRGSLETAVSVVNGKAIIAGAVGTTATPASVNVGNGDTVTVINGYPAATEANVDAMIDLDANEFGVAELTNAMLIFPLAVNDYATTPPDTTGDACTVAYTNSSAEGTRPQIVVNTCVN